jgi:ubiquinone/menaquinone biosynthesis C-methylase UbiE
MPLSKAWEGVMTVAAELQADQRPEAWDDHVSLYEEVFEPLSVAFMQAAAARLEPMPGMEILDVAAGAGGGALALARNGAAVTAVDASPRMVARMRHRAEALGLPLDTRVMDGMRLNLPDEAFDAALSVFGVILFPDAVRGLEEMRRVVRPGGRIAVVTWTQPHRYELAVHLREAIAGLGVGGASPATLPAQLRFVQPDAFRRLFAQAGLEEIELVTVEAAMPAPSAHWLAERIRFAPGMAAWMASLGDREREAREALIVRLEREHGPGPLSLGATAMIGIARV